MAPDSEPRVSVACYAVLGTLLSGQRVLGDAWPLNRSRPSFLAECPVAKPNYSFEKRQREVAKNKKKEEKNQRRLAKSPVPGDVPAESPLDTSAPADSGNTTGTT